MLRLVDLDFVRKHMDVILIGSPGGGKTLFTSTMDMLNHLIAAEAGHSLLKKIKYYSIPDLLICDDIGSGLLTSTA